MPKPLNRRLEHFHPTTGRNRGVDAADPAHESRTILPDTMSVVAAAHRPHVVELLYFEGCPHYEAMLARLRELLRSAGAGDRIQLRRIPDERAARRERFLGSPTVRVDGHDVEPGASERSDFRLICRLYVTADGLRPTPLDEWVLDALARPARG
jgi:hypothetical protein